MKLQDGPIFLWCNIIGWIYVNSVNTYNEINTSITSAIHHLVLTQLGMKAGIKLWGEDGVRAIVKAMKQFNDRKVVTPMLPQEVTPEVKAKALGYLMFLKMKRSGDIKGRGCADGRPQRVYMDKGATSSPTPNTESIFMTAMIEAMEQRDVATVDIPGAFLQTKASDGTIIKLQGTLVNNLIKIDEEWAKYVVYEGRNKVPTVYSTAIKALYGTVDAAKLFYDNLSNVLINQLGFKRNDYDPCVVNKQIKGHQCTIVWHVDDLKISHKDKDVVSWVIAELNKRYGDIMPVTEHRGPVHDYLGMIFDFSTGKEVQITMYQYIDGVLKTAQERYKTGVGMATPASTNSNHTEEEDVELFDGDKREEYHSLTAQLHYMSKRGRPDLQQSIAFH